MQAFLKRNVEMISIHLNKLNIDYVKHNDVNGTKLKILTFTFKTYFHELRNTVYLCRLQPNYDSECKKFDIGVMRCNFLSQFILCCNSQS